MPAGRPPKGTPEERAAAAAAREARRVAKLAHKATEAIRVKQRVDQILRFRLDSAEFWDIVEVVREEEVKEGSLWFLKDGEKPITESSLRRYLAKVDDLIAESCRASRKKLMRRHLAQRRNIVAKAIIAGDLATALRALDSEANLLRLHPPITHEHSGKGGKPIQCLFVEVASANHPTDDPGSGEGDRPPAEARLALQPPPGTDEGVA